MLEKSEKMQAYLKTNVRNMKETESKNPFCYRATDIDDLMTNTLGTFLGYGLFKLVQYKFAERLPNKTAQLDDKDENEEPMKHSFVVRHELAICFLIFWLSTFFIQGLLTWILLNQYL